MFEVSEVKKEILGKLAERDWTPTELADELDRSTETVYNHLNGLAEMGILEKRKVPAKTRPKTEYSIGRGFAQYLAVLPGRFISRTLSLGVEKEVILRIWDVPQEEFHSYLENFWWSVKNHTDIDFKEDIVALAVYGSVARGTADEESDIDMLVVVDDEDTAESVKDSFGTVKVDAIEGSKLFMSQVYTKNEYIESREAGSDFLEKIDEDLLPIYDPEGFYD